MNIEQALEQIGLSKGESVVYTATLKLGLAKASQIAQKANMRRGGAYYLLKLLKERGFISEIIKSGVQYYSATGPERILDIIEEEKTRKREVVTSILPELKNMQSTAIERPIIEVYEGYEGFKTIFSKILEEQNKEIRCYLSPKILEFLPHFHEQFRKRRAEKKIAIRTITERTPQMEQIKKIDKKELRHTRFSNSLFKNAELLQYILDDAVISIKANKQEQIAIYIKESGLASIHKNIFDQFWQRAQE